MWGRERKEPRRLCYYQSFFVPLCAAAVWVFVSLAPGPVHTTLEDGG